MKSKRICVYFAVCIALLLCVADLPSQENVAAANAVLSREIHRAVSLAESGHLHEAMAIDEQILRQKPKYAPALKLKGILLEDSGQSAEAAAAYEQAWTRAPNDPDLLLKTGIRTTAAGGTAKA